jgi:nitrile hydratase subunit beta
MNGIHDMGGMQGFGPVMPEKNEPVFHSPWEGRLVAMRRAIGATGKLPPALRAAIESLPAADYLRMSYYEKWYAAVVELFVASGLMTREEIATGKRAKGSVKSVPPLKPAEAALLPFQLPRVMLKVAVQPRYMIGQQVRARKMNPLGHTRLPRYARGRTGVVERDQGVQAFPDTNVYGRGENPQHVYSVRFAARELWGEAASARDSVYIDLWEDYLEGA